MRYRLMVTAAVLCAAMPVFADSVLFDQSAVNANSLDFVNYRTADDFTLADGAIVDQINFWYQATYQTDLSEVAYGIYANSSGSLGALLYSGTATPVTADETLYFSAEIAVPNLPLSSGMYWLELHAGSSLTDDNGTITVWWSTADDNGTALALQDLSPTIPMTPVNLSGDEQAAFQIVGTLTTPEPGGLIALALSLAGMGWMVRRRGCGSRRRQGE
jgi:hypothetical protein